MPAASKVKMGGNGKKKKANRNTYVTRKFHAVVVSPINVILTRNVINVNQKCNTHHRCNKLLKTNVIIWLTIKFNKFRP